MTRLYTLCLLACVLGAGGALTGHAARTRGEHLFAGEGKIISSGRDADVLEDFNEINRVLFGPKGVLTRLGINHPDHVMHFCPGNEINCLVANNHHALPFWLDGANIIQSLTRGSGVLEFVCPSNCPLRSFYKDTLPLEQQLSIILHVAGHYHFMHHSRLHQKSEVDVQAESYALAGYIQKLIASEDPLEVSLWIQYLNTLAWSQDVSRGVHSNPEEFEPERVTDRFFLDPENRGKRVSIPLSPSPNIFQVYVANLPRTLPVWKRELAKRFERITRYYSGAIPTKIINEGFATIMQELAVEHLPEKYRTLKWGLEMHELHTGVTAKNIGSPYWFGRELYRNLRRQFNARSENQRLEPIERDRRFIQWVTHEVIERRDQYDTILFALDQTWFHEQKLAITRKANWDEWDHDLPPPEKDEDSTQHRVVSKDPDQLRRQLARALADSERSFPRVLITDYTDAETGNVALGFAEGSFGAGIPLQRDSMVSTLLVHARANEKPAQLDTVKFSQWDERKTLFQRFATQPIFGPPYYPPWEDEPQVPATSPIRVVVTPQGRVTVLEWVEVRKREEVETPAAWRANTFLTEDFQKRLDTFVQEIDFGREMDGSVKDSTIRSIAAAAANSVPTGMMFHAPTAPEAILRYNIELNRRLAKVLLDALTGKRQFVRTSRGVAVKALPKIPQFRFDRNAMQVLSRAKMSQGNPSWLFSRVENPYTEDDGHNLNETEANEGENIWGPDDQGDGDGVGDGDGDPEDGDQGRPRRPGDPSDGQGFDPNDPSWVVIPPELYAEFLAEKVELPRLRPKGGISPLKDMIEDGAVARRDGEAVMNEIARRALIRARTRGGENVKKMSRAQQMRLGFRYLEPGDWRVDDQDVTPDPDINAVVHFMLDGSGSMGGDRLMVAKKMIYDLKTILKKRYPKVEFRFVTFDTRAKIHESEDEFFKFELLGGTDYLAGLKAVHKSLEKFPRALWDRYTIGVGDLEDGNVDEIINKFKEIAADCEYSGMVRANGWEGDWDMGKRFEQLAQEDPYIGYLDLEGLKYSPSDFRKLFKNEKK
ncbi:MAG: SpoVR family protein [Deltaproteobacteria bacterium]|nr:SpoVR family protein [Deltaproteobacteria bacterium]